MARIWDTWRSGVFIGDTAPSSRVTVEKSYTLRKTGAVVGQWKKGPARWFQRADASEVETELPNVQTVNISRGMDQDAGTCEIAILNVAPQGYGQLPALAGQYGDIGYYTFDHGTSPESRARWGHRQNPWLNVLVPNALIRVYQGFGGHELSIDDAINDGHIVLNGVFLIDDVGIYTDGLIHLKCRDMGKLVVDQQIVPPLVPTTEYPLKYMRYTYQTFKIPPDPAVDGHSGSIHRPRFYDYDVTSSSDIARGEFNAVINGHRPTDALDWPNDTSLWLSEARGGPNDFVFTEFRMDPTPINQIHLHCWAGNYKCYLSIFENGNWVSPEASGLGGVIPSPNPVEAIPYVMYTATPWEHHNDIMLPREYQATKYRVTFTNLQRAQEGGFRAGVRNVTPVFNWDVPDRPPPLNFGAAAYPYNTNNLTGYWQVRSNGRIAAFGDARIHVAGPNQGPNHTHPVLGIAAHPSGNGYWTLDSSGKVIAYGVAENLGDSTALGRTDVVDMAVNPAGDGYWVLHSNGDIDAFGGAAALGQSNRAFTMPAGAPGQARNIETHPTLAGYWVLWSDGVVVPFGAVTHYGNANRTNFETTEYVNALHATHTGAGYRITSGKGIVQTFGDAVHLGNATPYPKEQWVLGLCWDLIPYSNSDRGYAVQYADGNLHPFGDFEYFGSMGGDEGQIRLDGNYKDYTDIVRDLLLWAGFYLYRNPQPGTEMPDVYGNLENTGVFSKQDLPQAMFDKVTVADAIRALKEIVGYCFFIDEEGAARFECVDDRTEALTRRGWVKGSDLQSGDEVLSLNPGTGLSEWTTVDDVARYDVVDEELVSIEGRLHSSLTTKGHRWWVTPAHQSRGQGRWVESAALSTESRIPIAVERGDAPVPTIPDELVELVAWWYTEGHTRPGGKSGVISQSGRINPDLVKRIRFCFEQLAGQPGFLRDGHQWCEYSSAEEMVCWRFKGDIYDALNRWAPDRVPTMAFLTALSVDQAKMFVEISVAADGHTREGYSEFVQKDPRRVAVFEVACVLAGLAFRTRSYDGRRDVHRVKVAHSSGVKPVGAARNVGAGGRVTMERYTGEVWCPKLSRHHVWLARRNGTVYYTGNSPNWWQMGNFGTDGTPIDLMPEVDEAVNLTDWQMSFADTNARSEIIISTEDPYPAINGATLPTGILTTRIVPPSAVDLKGIVKPAMWFNGIFTDDKIQQIMADLIAMHIWFARRQGTASCVANPLIGINDQVRIYERQTGEVYIHYVRGVTISHDLTSGDFSMTLNTHWMGGSAYGENPLFLAGAEHPDGDGYWMVASNGNVYAFGNAIPYAKNMPDSHVDWVVAMRPTSTGEGYYTIDTTGRIITYGDAVHYGDLFRPEQDVKDLAPTPTGNGYWVVTDNGTVDAFGDAVHHGNSPVTGTMPSGDPVIAHAIESHPTIDGYWVLWSNGVVTAHDLLHHGNADRVGFTLAEYVGSLRRTASGSGYYIVSGSGIVQAFGDAAAVGNADPTQTTLVDLIWDIFPNYGGGTGYGLLRASGEFETFGTFVNAGSVAAGGLGNTHPWAIVNPDTYDQVNDPRWYVPATSGIADFLSKSGSPSGNNAAANGFGAPETLTIKARVD